MKDEQIIALYFARNEDAIGETDKKYGARLLQLAQRISSTSLPARRCARTPI